MPTFNVLPSYFRNIKTIRLKALLGTTADVYPLRLWAMLTDFDPDSGTCRDMSDAELEAVLGWTGESGALVHSLTKVGFLEVGPDGNLRAHDWQEHEGHLKAYRERSKKATARRWGVPEGEKEEKPAEEPSAISAPEAASEKALKVIDALVKCQRVKITNTAVILAWESAFPDVDLARELLKADAWAVANNVTRTGKGWARTMTTWLGKEQDRVKAGGAFASKVGAAKPQENKYNGL